VGCQVKRRPFAQEQKPNAWKQAAPGMVFALIVQAQQFVLAKLIG
jgi:hypothetical protein